MQDIKSHAHLLTPAGREHYLNPGIVNELAPLHATMPGYHEAARIMIRERPLTVDQIDLVAALLLLWKSSMSSLNERIMDLHNALGQLQDAQEIADDVARRDIEVNCRQFNEDGTEPSTTDEMSTGWYDLQQQLDVGAGECIVKKAEAYLERRKLLFRHPFKPHWVRFRSAPDAAPEWSFPASQIQGLDAPSREIVNDSQI